MGNEEATTVRNLSSDGVTTIETAQRSVTDWSAELSICDLPWVIYNASLYQEVLERLPQVFAWEDSNEVFAILQTLQRSTALRRWCSFLQHVRTYEPVLAQRITETFDALPAQGKLRVLTAPETYRRIALMKSEPGLSIMLICNSLNAESVLYGLGPAKGGYCTALGDAYYVESAKNDNGQCDCNIQVLKAPILIDELPIDYFSPNVQNAKKTSGPGPAPSDFGDYTNEQIQETTSRLQDAFSRIAKTSVVAAQLIRDFVKVIIPLKVAEGYGSTSQPRFPGRVLLRGIENSPPGVLASVLVHESMHQLMYVLEFSGEFVMPLKGDEKHTATSLWTGRDLALHSFIHACFVWYGLVQFWTLPGSDDVFEKNEQNRELARALSGFKQQNPVDFLKPHLGKLRSDVVAVAGTLQARLGDAVTTRAVA